MALSGFEEPLQPSAPVPAKLQQEFFLMAPMGDMPNMPGNVMPVCSWHFASFLKELFARQKQYPKTMKRAIYSSVLGYFK
jgi:hypothetical protein